MFSEQLSEQVGIIKAVGGFLVSLQLQHDILIFLSYTCEIFATYIMFTKSAIGFWKLLLDLSLPDKNKINELRGMIRFGVHFSRLLLVAMCLSYLC